MMRPVCCFPECERPTAPEIHLPICAKHARHAYLAVKDLMDSASVAAVASTARATGTARPRAGVRLGTVYFMRFGDLIKIGFTTNIGQRVQALKPDEVLTTIPGTMQDEKALHHRFGAYWVGGELFRPAPELVTFIAQNADAA